MTPRRREETCRQNESSIAAALSKVVAVGVTNIASGSGTRTTGMQLDRRAPPTRRPASNALQTTDGHRLLEGCHQAHAGRRRGLSLPDASLRPSLSHAAPHPMRGPARATRRDRHRRTTRSTRRSRAAQHPLRGPTRATRRDRHPPTTTSGSRFLVRRYDLRSSHAAIARGSTPEARAS